MTAALLQPCWSPSCREAAIFNLTIGDNTVKACGKHANWFPLPLSQESTLEYRTTKTDGGYDWSSPPINSIRIDDNHFYVKLLWEEKWVGIDEWHKKADGRWCVGYCLFNVPGADEWAHAYVGDVKTRWTVTFDPLTMAPSVACKVCPSHGFIQQGRWVGA